MASCLLFLIEKVLFLFDSDKSTFSNSLLIKRIAEYPFIGAKIEHLAAVFDD
jgi:hypothetical protein